jgi:glycosyltransferase involved in cell wall biosynthesis
MEKNYINNSADVAIWMVTFNHAEFIAQAIESVISQRTTFSYKLVIADDCSTDNTKEICKSYVLKFPDKILYYRNKTNLGSSLNGQLNYERCFKISRKYIALLEGDDFWIDNDKLQKQYDLLENPVNRAYVVCATNYIEFYQDKQKFSDNWAFFQGVHGREMIKGVQFELIDSDGWKTKTATILFRKNALKVRRILRYRLMVDSILVYELSKFGKKMFLNDCTAAYRLHDQGIWSLKSEDEKRAISKKINLEIKRVNFLEEVILKKIKKRFGLFNNL